MNNIIKMLFNYILICIFLSVRVDGQVLVIKPDVNFLRAKNETKSLEKAREILLKFEELYREKDNSISTGGCTQFYRDANWWHESPSSKRKLISSDNAEFIIEPTIHFFNKDSVNVKISIKNKELKPLKSYLITFPIKSVKTGFNTILNEIYSSALTSCENRTKLRELIILTRFKLDESASPNKVHWIEATKISDDISKEFNKELKKQIGKDSLSTKFRFLELNTSSQETNHLTGFIILKSNNNQKSFEGYHILISIDEDIKTAVYSGYVGKNNLDNHMVSKVIEQLISYINE